MLEFKPGPPRSNLGATAYGGPNGKGQKGAVERCQRRQYITVSGHQNEARRAMTALANAAATGPRQGIVAPPGGGTNRTRKCGRNGLFTAALSATRVSGMVEVGCRYFQRGF